MRYEVVVVGGGPAGALAAAAAAQAGAKTLLLERAPKRIPCCAGLVSWNTAQRLRVPPSLVLREIRGVRVVSPQGKAVELRAAEAKAVVLDRRGLDSWLRTQAQEAGAEVWLKAARGLRGEEVLTTRDRGQFEVLVGADGTRSGVAKWAGLPWPRKILVALQAEVQEELGDVVEVHLGIVPDFFAWAVPAEEGVTRVGLATAPGNSPFPKLRDFLPKRFPKGKILSFRAGLIPLDTPSEIVRGRVLLVGNAAGQVKPLTGGGLAFLSLCAPLAGKLAAQGPEALRHYPQKCWELIGKEMEFEEHARESFLRLSPQALEEIVRTFEHPKLQAFLAEVGDIDHFAGLGQKLLRSPKIWPLLIPLARWLPREGSP